MTQKNAHGLLGEIIGDLREIWIEIPGDCHLNCKYCFAFENTNDFKFINNGNDIIRTDLKKDLLSLKETIENIRQFDEDFPLSYSEKNKGVKKRLAIPSAGEPFVNERMKEYTYGVIDECEKRDIIITVFTTADKITEEDMCKLYKYKNLRLYVKYNSPIADIQDKLVGRKGYTEKRNQKLRRLIEKGFNDGRLGIVTSVMKDNYKEIEESLIYARENNIEFDADTIIDRGRGKDCKCKFDVNDEKEDKKMLSILRKLQKLDKEKYCNDWILTSTYVGSNPCTRFDHHVYIKRNGNVSPCVGSPQIVYGNTRETSLKKLWENSISKLIRRHNINGVCAKCKNFIDKKCYSCLARSTSDDFTQDYLLKTGQIPTKGCNICGPIKVFDEKRK